MALVDSVLVCVCFAFNSCRLFGDMVLHFPVSQEEITLSMSPLRVGLKNYYEGGDGELMLQCDLAQTLFNAVTDINSLKVTLRTN